ANGVTMSQGGYALASVRLGYRYDKHWSAAVNVNNLFDREYVSSCYSEYACYWGAERQVVATATFRF
ncbi:TonB-dependent receptor, partial [Burkholderia multivorans]|uniref:TonB-dependent receptor n=1 Tax=Burkholderia multivorans TaxID=87883 RepID=UPI0018DC5BA7